MKIWQTFASGLFGNLWKEFIQISKTDDKFFWNFPIYHTHTKSYIFAKIWLRGNILSLWSQQGMYLKVHQLPPRMHTLSFISMCTFYIIHATLIKHNKQNIHMNFNRESFSLQKLLQFKCMFQKAGSTFWIHHWLPLQALNSPQT